VAGGKGQSKSGEEWRRWVKLVGVERATAARNVRQLHPERRMSLPELLAEAWLIKRGVQYETQVELGMVRPDVVVFDCPASLVPTGEEAARDLAVAWAVQGDYWHKDKLWHDEGKANLVAGMVWRGYRIVDMLMVWESDIYEAEQVFEDALAGMVRRK
jgi:hypothetical protein